MSAPITPPRAPANNRRALCLSAAFALCVHAGVFWAWRSPPENPPLVELDGDSMEVALVEPSPSAPLPAAAAEPAEATPEPTETTNPPAPEPPVADPPMAVVEPEPPPPPVPPEMVLSDPPKAAPPPKTAAPPKPSVKRQRAVSSPRQTTVGSSTAPGTGGPDAAGTGSGANGAGKPTGKPAYLVRPEASYPAESRAAREQGVVMLRIVVDGNGRPTAVSVAWSSGFPRLDRAAVEGGWRSRMINTPGGAQLNAPVRFRLDN